MKKALFVFFILTCMLFSDDNYFSHDLEDLHLSGQQKEAFENILKHHRDEVKIYRKRKKESEKLKQNLFLEEVFDKEKFAKINDQVSSFGANIEGNFLYEIHQLLNAKQRKKFAKDVEEWEIE
ncbi:MAG: hypothetical protein IBX44_05235 [Sulfurospirillum sp.]|nr:hypothetical protein [Sulfurospirillum sp.]